MPRIHSRSSPAPTISAHHLSKGSKEAAGPKQPPCQPLQAAHVGRAGLRRRAALAASRAAMPPGVLLAQGSKTALNFCPLHAGAAGKSFYDRSA
eukprot:3753860-Pleurochrysis_carterae.AAC.1